MISLQGQISKLMDLGSRQKRLCWVGQAQSKVDPAWALTPPVGWWFTGSGASSPGWKRCTGFGWWTLAEAGRWKFEEGRCLCKGPEAGIHLQVAFLRCRFNSQGCKGEKIPECGLWPGIGGRIQNLEFSISPPGSHPESLPSTLRV